MKNHVTKRSSQLPALMALAVVTTLTVPLLTLEQPQNNAVRFSLQYRGGIRYYNGRWDGQTLAGAISRDPAGTEGVATFTLRRR